MRSHPEAFAAALKAACIAHPQQRSCQVIVNALGLDPFYMEDSEAINKLFAYAREGNRA